MNETELKEDLEKKLLEFVSDLEEFAKQKLNTLITSGSGVLQDHEQNSSNWITPRNVSSAILQEYARQVQFANDKQTNKIVSNYLKLL